MEIESNSPEKSYKEKLIRGIKKEVKQIMEEAVTKKFIHEDSASITSLCGAVETCMSHGLKRRALGLFKSSSTSALLHKVAKSYRPAAAIVQIVAEIENCDPNKRSSGSESASRLGLGGKVQLQKRNSIASNTKSFKYLWIRVALVEKQLAKIIDYVVLNSCKYYEKDALVADSEYGSILSSLLVGPCALDYSKLRTIEHLFTDQSADELIQRHRISSGQFPASPPVYKRPALNYKGSGGYSFISDDNQRSKDYVESLHQNNKTTLLYGKNNVLVYLNSNIKEPLANVNNQMAGYLSLHQCGEMLNLKWTPNTLMNGSESTFDKSVFWEHALNLLVHEVVYIHCHQGENSDWIVLVGQDGVQRAPIHFPRGGHLLAFLSCLENGLLPHGMLDPPLWSQKGKGKVFPKLKRKVSRFSSSPGGSGVQDEVSPTHQGGSDGGSDGGEDPTGHIESSADFVFRIVYTNFFRSAAKSKRSNARAPLSSSSDFSDGLLTVEELLDEPLWRTASEGHKPNLPATPRSTPLHSVSTTSSTSSSRSLEQQGSVNESGEPIQIVCQTMKKQIISRAFYGWLAHCRHLRTIRTHLVGLVQPNIVLEDQVKNAHEGLTEARWKEFQDSGCDDIYEIYKLVYFGGIAHSLRRKLWPLLLAGSLKEDDPEELRREYENKMSEWLAVEAIVRQRDKETMAANLAKLSSEHSESGVSVSSQAIERILEASDSNEVFEENENSGECTKEREQVKKIALGKKISGKVESLSNLLMRKTENGTKESEKSTEKTIVVEKIKDNETNGQSKIDSDTVSSTDKSIKAEAPTTIQQNGDEQNGTEKVEFAENHIVNGDGIHEIETTEKELATGDQTEGVKCDPKDILDANVNDIGTSDENGGSREKIKILEKMDSDSISSDDSRQETGGVYSNELLESFALNLHRIEKDVKRCDRNYWYFTEPNLEKLRNIMCTYVWDNMEMGYMQGMCDLAAPLLVILDDEAQTYASFRRLMSRMGANFPSGGGAMDAHFANMRSLLQVMDHDLFALIRQNGDYTHFYFCYRWFLLDFKREFCYDDVFLVWESIWAARYVSSPDYVLFLALALLSYYRDIVLANSMDFTDIIKFFNEMAERHNAKVILGIARNLVLKLQTLIENK